MGAFPSALMPGYRIFDERRENTVKGKWQNLDYKDFAECDRKAATMGPCSDPPLYQFGNTGFTMEKRATSCACWLVLQGTRMTKRESSFYTLSSKVILPSRRFIKERIDMAVFPALQGGPHNHQIGALAAHLLEVNTPEFVGYSKAVVSNAGTLAEALIAKGHKLASGGTDNHLLFWDLRPHGLTGSKVQKVCEAASISLNRHTVPGDASELSPGGVRIGAPAMTTRGCTTEDFKRLQISWTGVPATSSSSLFLTNSSE